MFNQKQLHLVPEVIKNRAASLLSESSGKNIQAEKEVHAATLEAVISYCQSALESYRKKSSFNYKKRA